MPAPTAVVTTVPGTLASTPNARRLSGLDLGFGRSTALWRNNDCEVVYERPAGHTFSFYTRGGTGTRRLDRRGMQGWPGAVSVLPEGVRSDWLITGRFEFLHLYLPDAELRRAFVETYEGDARAIDLADLTYVEAPALEPAFRALAAATAGGHRGAAEAATAELVAAILGTGPFAPRRRLRLTGGLAPHRLRQVRERIEAELDAPLSLADLAGEAGLSAFHFQRAFRASAGVSPHVWIAHRRIARAKALIRTGSALAEVAAACGYANQSHFTRAFRAATGTTPAAWRGEAV